MNKLNDRRMESQLTFTEMILKVKSGIIVLPKDGEGKGVSPTGEPRKGELLQESWSGAVHPERRNTTLSGGFRLISCFRLHGIIS